MLSVLSMKLLWEISFVILNQGELIWMEENTENISLCDKAPIISAIWLAIIGFFGLNFSITFINEIFAKIIPLQIKCKT